MRLMVYPVLPNFCKIMKARPFFIIEILVWNSGITHRQYSCQINSAIHRILYCWFHPCDLSDDSCICDWEMYPSDTPCFFASINVYMPILRGFFVIIRDKGRKMIRIIYAITYCVYSILLNCHCMHKKPLLDIRFTWYYSIFGGFINHNKRRNI